MLSIEKSLHVEAAPDKVWQVVSKHEEYPRWSAVKHVSLTREGAPDRNGVGAVRVMKVGPLSLVEEITGFEPGRRLAYDIKSGFPNLRHESAEILLSPERGGTRIDYTAKISATL